MYGNGALPKVVWTMPRLFDLSDKVAVVTGAASGIGEATARRPADVYFRAGVASASNEDVLAQIDL